MARVWAFDGTADRVQDSEVNPTILPDTALVGVDGVIGYQIDRRSAAILTRDDGTEELVHICLQAQTLAVDLTVGRQKGWRRIVPLHYLQDKYESLHHNRTHTPPPSNPWLLSFLSKIGQRESAITLASLMVIGFSLLVAGVKFFGSLA